MSRVALRGWLHQLFPPACVTDVAEGDEWMSAIAAGPEDVRMLQLGRCLDLGQEPLSPHDCSQLGLEHLERHLRSCLRSG